MPGAAVAIGLNGPRISAGASGFMSQQVHLAGRTQVEDHDHAALVVIRSNSASRLEFGQLRERQADGAERADLQELAARQAVAGVRFAAADQIEHGCAPPRYVARNGPAGGHLSTAAGGALSLTQGGGRSNILAVDR